MKLCIFTNYNKTNNILLYGFKHNHVYYIIKMILNF